MDSSFHFLADNINSHNSHTIVSIHNKPKKLLTVTCRLDTDDRLDLDDAATYAKYWMTFFVFSVFPAPDSPLKVIWQFKIIKNVALSVHLSSRIFFYWYKNSALYPSLISLVRNAAGTNSNSSWDYMLKFILCLLF